MYIESIHKIADHYGYEPQSRQLIEEMDELTQAINKFWRKDLDCGKKDFQINPIPLGDGILVMSDEYHNLIEEIADVEIMLEQIKYLLKCSEGVSELVSQKIFRQLVRIEREKTEKEKE